jgi:transposase-like protein
VRTDGKRESLAVEVANTENETTWLEVFRELKRRGLSGVRCIVSDDHEGLSKAIDRYFQGVAWQRRFHQELERRTRVVQIFPNRASCLRLVTALAMEQSEEWLTGRRYLDMSLLNGESEMPRGTEVAGEEVVMAVP